MTVRGFVILAGLSVLTVGDVRGSIVWVLAVRLMAVVLGLAAGVAAVSLRAVEVEVREDVSPAEVDWRAAVSYGLPLLATNLLTLVIEFGDRYILAFFFDAATLAGYVVALKIAAILQPVAIAPFGLWWPVERFRRLRDPDGGEVFFRSTALRFLTILLVAAGVLWMASPSVAGVVAPGVPFDAVTMMLLVFATVAAGMGSPLNITLLDEGRTHANLYPVLGGAAIHLTCCLLLIPHFGAVGGAMATLAGYTAYTLLVNRMSQRFRRIGFRYGAMGAMTAIAAFILIAIHLTAPDGTLPGKIAGALLYAVVLGAAFLAVGRETGRGEQVLGAEL